jgi:hypothetical protein
LLFSFFHCLSSFPNFTRPFFIVCLFPLLYSHFLICSIHTFDTIPNQTSPIQKD